MATSPPSSPVPEARSDQHLDCTGLICPLPVLRASKRLKGMEAGQILEVLATDKAAPRDIEAFCREAGHRLLDVRAVDGVHHFRIRKAG